MGCCDIRTRIPCFTNDIVRHSIVHGEGMGRVISAGVYFMLSGKADWEMWSGRAGEKVSSARPLVGVVYSVRIEQ